MSKASSPPKFTIDDAVKVQHGVIDPDFDDVGIGGWAGTVAKLQDCSPPMYLVRWNQRTQDSFHPAYRNRCDREGFDKEDMWLAQEDLESDTGEPTAIPQPDCSASSPLSLHRRDDRIRLAFGLSGDDPIPKPGETTLSTYRKYLTASLAFPFEGTYFSASTSYAITVLDLLHSDAFPKDEDGLFCNAHRENDSIMLPLIDVDLAEDHPNWGLLDDYSAWFVNWWKAE